MIVVIEDFFRLGIDVLLYFPYKTLSSTLMKPILSAATASLTLLKEEPLLSVLHFLRDLLAYGGDFPPSSSFNDSSAPTNQPQGNPPEVQSAVKNLVAEQGETLTQRIMTGMMYTFPRDCFPDASGVMLAMFQLMPQQTSQWIKTTIGLLPAGSIMPQESERFLGNIDQYVCLSFSKTLC